MIVCITVLFLCITVLLLCNTLYYCIITMYYSVFNTVAVMHPMWRHPSITARQQTHHGFLCPPDKENSLTAEMGGLEGTILKKSSLKHIFNRPSVTKPVLQTLLSLIH